jgi:cellulose synthase operon protein C
MNKNPNDPQVLAAFVQMLLDHDSSVAAVEFPMGNLERLAPDNPFTKVLKARLLIKKNQAPEGVALIKSLIPQPLPDDQVRLLLQVGNTLEELGQLDAAKEVFGQYAARVPGGCLALAAFYGKHGKIEEALDQVDAAVGKVPVAAVLPVVINVLTEQRKKGPIAAQYFQRVEHYFKKAEEDAPDTKLVQVQTAALRDLQDNYAEQTRIYQDFLSRGDVSDRDKAIVWNNLAFLLAADGKRPEEALKMINQAIDFLGPVPELLDTRAVVLMANGKTKEAIADLRDAISDSASGVMYFHLAKALAATGNPTDAARNLQIAHDSYQLTLDRVPKIEREEYQKLAAKLKSP